MYMSASRLPSSSFFTDFSSSLIGSVTLKEIYEFINTTMKTMRKITNTINNLVLMVFSEIPVPFITPTSFQPVYPTVFITTVRAVLLNSSSILPSLYVAATRLFSLTLPEAISSNFGCQIISPVESIR